MNRVARGDQSDLTAVVTAEHFATGGKRLRARLALAAVDALGADAHTALGWAAACEMLHNATLLHDDLQDGDRMRRGHPTAWVRHGMAQAINGGDLLLVLPFAVLSEVDCSDSVRWQLCRVTAERAAAVIRGQSAEMMITDQCTTDRTAYLHAIEGKTSGLFQLPVEGAALIAGRTPESAAALAAPFRALGRLFQMQDDVLDLYGDKGREAVGADLKEGKISALVVEHLDLHPDDGPWLTALLQTPREQTTDAEITRAIERFRDGGALAAVRGAIDRLADDVAAAPALQPEPALRDLAQELIAVILEPIQHVMKAPRPTATPASSL